MVRCPHKDCSDSDREFESDSSMRQHHTMVHDEQLPNSKCNNCGNKFFRKSGGSYCDDCKGNKGVNNPNYKGKVDYIDKILERAVCSENGCNESRPVALCFHHKPKYEKVGAVSRMSVTAEYSIEELKEEVEKCEVICHNCHCERHADTEPDIDNHTIDWSSYRETNIEIDGQRVFRNEHSRKFTLRNCEYCGQKFLSRVVERNRDQGKFHSLRCAGKSRKVGDKDTKLGLVKSLKKEGECSRKDCSESRPHCLQFHHIERGDKDESIQQIVGYGDMEDLKSELKKCELLCANCHKIEHSECQ